MLIFHQHLTIFANIKHIYIYNIYIYIFGISGTVSTYGTAYVLFSAVIVYSICEAEWSPGAPCKHLGPMQRCPRLLAAGSRTHPSLRPWGGLPIRTTCASIYIPIPMYIYACMSIYIYVYTYTCMHICIIIYILHIYTYRYTHEYKDIYIQYDTHTWDHSNKWCICVYAYYIYIHIHLYLYVYTHISICIYTKHISF